jgi:hypothetical protein
MRLLGRAFSIGGKRAQPIRRQCREDRQRQRTARNQPTDSRQRQAIGGTGRRKQEERKGRSQHG